MNSPSPPSDWKRGFWSLMGTQFQGAFSDNLLKVAALNSVQIAETLGNRCLKKG